MDDYEIDELCDSYADEIRDLKAVLRPLLDHYLNCYEGNKDELARRAECLLMGNER